MRDFRTLQPLAAAASETVAIRHPVARRLTHELGDDAVARWLLAAACVALAVGIGSLGTLRPRLTLVACLALAVIVCVSVRPALGGYLVIGLTPLAAGIDRGHAIPLFRPSEALALAVGVALSTRAISRWRTGSLPRWRPSPVEWALILMALSNSVLPMLWMTVRHQAITQDDLLYALVMWKFAGFYLIVRSSITTNRQVVRGLWLRGRRHRPILAVATVLFAFGALSAGEFSSAIGLVVGICCIAVVTSYPRLLALFVPLAGFAVVLLRPVIAARVSGFESVSGLPVSWTGRLSNLRSYFWPKLFSDWNILFGVRPSARVPVSYQATGYVWIESGYTWLLWGGGIPLVVCFVFFVQAAARLGWRVARHSVQPPSAAALAVFVSVIVMTVLMLFDPHLTYRGAAEEMFALLALAAVHERRSNDATNEYTDEY